MRFLIIALLSFCFLPVFSQKNESLAKTPPMGWDSRNSFKTNCTEGLIKNIVDSIVSKGLKDAGYSYIIIDDGWMSKSRDKQGNIVADSIKFHHGIKALADYIHSKGLKIGLSACAGEKTCAGFPGSKKFENKDAQQVALWGVDYVKYDWCNTSGLQAEDAYSKMSKALQKTGRPIVFSINDWGASSPWAWASSVAQLWRTTGNSFPCFECEKRFESWSSWGIMNIVNMRQVARKYAGPGHWNDPDMLVVGNGMTLSEDRSHFALWCMMAAPLFIGTDACSLSNETLGLLKNKDLIAIDQDELGIQGFHVSQKDSMGVWAKPLANKEWALCFLNTSSKPYDLNYNWLLNPIVDKDFNYALNLTGIIYNVKDLFNGNLINSTKRNLVSKIASHDVLMVRLIKKN